MSAESNANFAYGEVDFHSFVELLQFTARIDANKAIQNDSSSNHKKYSTQSSSGGTFVDLGCGSGKALVCAALSGVLYTYIRGIEILPTLCKIAREVANECSNIYAEKHSINIDSNDDNSIPTVEVL